MPNRNDIVNHADYDTALSRVNDARARWSLATKTGEAARGNSVFASIIQDLKAWVNEANTQSGCNTSLSNIPDVKRGVDVVMPPLIQFLYDDATTIYNYCPCQSQCSCDSHCGDCTNCSSDAACGNSGCFNGCSDGPNFPCTDCGTLGSGGCGTDRSCFLGSICATSNG